MNLMTLRPSDDGFLMTFVIFRCLFGPTTAIQTKDKFRPKTELKIWAKFGENDIMRKARLIGIAGSTASYFYWETIAEK